MLLTKRGFTIVELLIALMLMGIVSTAIYTLLINNQRLYRQQTQTLAVNDNVRSAAAIITSELRELDAADPLGGDIVDMAEDSITYRAMRGMRWVCYPGGLPVTTGYLPVDTTKLGLDRSVDKDYDSLLIFADHNVTIMGDDRWYHANVTVTPATGVDCGGKSSRRITYVLNMNGVTPAARVGGPVLVGADDVIVGAPVRIFEMARLKRYVDLSGATWLGMRRYNKNTGWSELQPVVGPLTDQGLKFAYFDSTGAATSNPAIVARVRVTVIGRTSDKVTRTSTGMAYLVDTLVTDIALRNSR